MRRPTDDHGGEFYLTDDELAYQASKRDAETVLRWWRQLTQDLHFECRSAELPAILEEIRREPPPEQEKAA